MMTANTPATRKAKGRSFQNNIAQWFRLLLQDVAEQSMEEVYDCVKPAIMGESGKDIQLDKFAREQLGNYAIECKDTERARVWQWIAQAEQNSNEKEVPVVFFKRNRQRPYVLMSTDHFFELVRNSKN